MLLRLFIALLFGVSFPGWSLCQSSRDLPSTWAAEWTGNLRVIIAWNQPYILGKTDCSTLIRRGAPKLAAQQMRIRQCRADDMAKGLYGWAHRPVSPWDVKEGTLGFTPGHVVWVVRPGKMSLGEMRIIQSRSSRGPTEEFLSQAKWWWDKNPKFGMLQDPSRKTK